MSGILTALSASEILALTIIGEAEGEPIEGQVGVGNIAMNRFKAAPHKYKSLHDVCLEPKQFSCWNEEDPNRKKLLALADKMISGQIIDEPYYSQCLWVAIGIVERKIKDNTYNALHYLANSLFVGSNKPSWANHPKNIHPLGNQTFFNI